MLKGSLYYYIDSKEDLLWRAIEEVHEEWSKILERATQLEAGPLEQIHAFIKLHVEWYLAKVKEISVFFREWRHLSGERLETIKQRRRQYGDVVRDLLTIAQQDGQMSPDLDVVYAARYVLAAVNAVPDWYRASSADATDIADAYADMTVRLLANRPRPRRRATRARRVPRRCRTSASASRTAGRLATCPRWTDFGSTERWRSSPAPHRGSGSRSRVSWPRPAPMSRSRRGASRRSRRRARWSPPRVAARSR